MRLFEEAIRAPLVIAAPGRTAGKTSPRVVEFIDIYPTLVELCGLPAPGGLEGESLAPLLARPDAPRDRPAFTVLGNAEGGIRARSVRTERWHYFEHYDAQGKAFSLLYDHDADPREYKNLVGEPKYAPVVAQMQRLLKDQKRAAPAKP